MKKITFILPLCLIAQSIFLNPAQAADADITVTANLIASACTVDTTSVLIPIGNIESASLETAGATSPWSAVTYLQVSGCPQSTTSVNAVFSGPVAINGDANGYTTTLDGTVPSLSIQLADDKGNFLSNGKQYGDVAVVNKVAKMGIKARLYSSDGVVLPGSAGVAIGVTFNYK